MRRKTILISALVAMFALVGAAVAMATAQFKQTAQITFSSKKVNSLTGLKINLNAQDPGAPHAKPSPATKVVVSLPKGAKVDTSAAKVCTASDSDFNSKGANACPAGSRLGTGTADAITGLGAGIDPVVENIIAFAGKNQIIFLLTPKGAIGQTATIRGKIKKNVVTTPVPAFPIPGAGNASLTKFQVNLKAVSSGSGSKKKRSVTTPPTCPKAKNWVTTTKFNYEDGTTATVKSRSSCK
ncbi:MAG: hypothetical protein ACJ76V_12515 [Thermoleophilaceae bacterium]